MLRFSSVLRAGCLCSIATLVGCVSAPHHTDPVTARPVPHNYDAYYGLPPQQYAANTSAASGPHSSGMQVNPSAPTTYTVQKGDTLWGIARKFLKTPWYWPELWDKNQRIANPHLIRPGDVLHFGYVQAGSGNGVEKLVPRIRVEQKGSGQPLSTLAAFTVWPRIMSDEEIRNSPYILASRDDHRLVAPGETIYVKNLHNPSVGERLAVYHPDKPIHDPETGQLLGHQVTYSGYARLERADAISTASILESQGVVREGDRILPVDQRMGDLRAPIRIPQQKIRGQIAALYDAEYLGANCMVVVINRGKNQGIQPGYTVGVYTDGRQVEDNYQPYRGDAKRAPRETLPPEKVANAVVYSVHDNLSYALITESGREVKNGDKIGNP